MDETLADVIHDGTCMENTAKYPCGRYAKGKGNPHYDHYQQHAAELAEQLTPIIGSTNVLPVVRILVGELC
jgi:hypothetical protein